MQNLKMSELPVVEEVDAVGEVAVIYDEYKRVMEIPFIPNMVKGLAASPAALNVHWDMIKSLMKHSTLPETVLYMILYSIAKSKDSDPGSGNNALSCRTLGIEETTIRALIDNIDGAGTNRISEIIKFAMKVSDNPQGLAAESFERVREAGVTDDELLEIIQIVAIASYLNTIADALSLVMDSTL